MDLKKSIKREDLKGTLGEIADVIGVDNAISLAEYTGGIPIYIPQTKGALSKARARQIKAEFDDGATVKDLAARYGYSERWTQVICYGK